MKKPFKEFAIGNEIMKCYSLKNEAERKKENYNGLCMFLYYENLHSTGEWGDYKNGKRNGFITAWDKRIGYSKGYCIEEKKIDEWLHVFINEYIENEKKVKMEKCNYVNGKKEGSAILFWFDGGTEERYYKNGVKSGKAVRYFINGCREEITYVNNVAEGKGIYYFPDGRYKENQYRKGEFIGDGILFSKDREFLKVIKRNEDEENDMEKMIKKFEKKEKKIENILSQINFSLKMIVEYISADKNKIKLSPDIEKRLDIIREKTGENYEEIILRILREQGEQLILESINYRDKYRRKQNKWIEETYRGTETGNYIDNVRCGEWKEYNEAGKLITLQKYRNGELYGEEHFDEEVYPRYKWEIDEYGREQGEWIIDEIDEGCRKVKVIEYKDGIIEGKFFSNYRTGDKCEEGFYKNGNLDGKYVKYDDETGEIKTFGEYRNGKKEGKWIEKGREFIYKNGLRLGKYEYNGIIEDYREDGKIRVEKTYYASGEIKSIKIFVFNGEVYVQEGVHIRSPKKEKYLIAEYENGEKICEWKELSSVTMERLQELCESCCKEIKILIQNN